MTLCKPFLYIKALSLNNFNPEKIKNTLLQEH